MIQNLFILSQSGEVLIEKHWFSRVKRTVCDLFMEYVAKENSKFDVLPVISTPEFYLFHTCRNDVFFLTAVPREVAPLMVLEAQQCIIDTFVDYFKNVSETIVRENFALVYHLLDEMVDGGFPFTTEPNQLKEMISPPSVANKVLTVLGGGSSSVKDHLSSAAQSKLPWRRDNVKYVTNAIYFDIIESIDAIVSPDGTVTSSVIHGEIRCRCQLSGVPDLSLSLTRNVDLSDCSLHRCVRIAKFENERVISFIPPDGDFTLAEYKVQNQINIPIYVRPDFVWTKDQCKFSITVGQRFDVSNPATDIVIILPLPKAASATFVNTKIGSARVDQIAQICRWEIPSIPKDGLPTLEGSFTLSTSLPADERPTLRVQFQKKKHSASGIGVDGLVIKNVKYTPVRGVRVLTQAGRFQVRTQ